MPLETIPAGRRNPHARARALPIPSPSREKVAKGRMRVNALSQDAAAKSNAQNIVLVLVLRTSSSKKIIEYEVRVRFETSAWPSEPAMGSARAPACCLGRPAQGLVIPLDAARDDSGGAPKSAREGACAPHSFSLTGEGGQRPDEGERPCPSASACRASVLE